MRTTRSLRAITLFALLAIVIAACAGSSSVLSTVGAPVGEPANGAGAGYTEDDAAAAPSAAPEQPAAGVDAVVDDAKIIRTGTIDLEVSDVPKSLQAARNGIRAMGGYVGASSTGNDGDQPFAHITYRIPADRWEDALDLLRGLNGLTTKVVAEQTEAVEVTGQVIDLEARIRNLRASEVALQEIASKAVRIADVLEVQAQLTAVRGQIEQLSAQLADLENRAAFATLTASFRVPVIAVEVAQQGWDPAAVVDEASASLVSMLQALTSAGIWFVIVWVPVLVAFGLVALVAAWVVRRSGMLARRRDADITPVA